MVSFLYLILFSIELVYFVLFSFGGWEKITIIDFRILLIVYLKQNQIICHIVVSF